MPGSEVGKDSFDMFGALYGPDRILTLLTPGIVLSVFNDTRRGAAPGGSLTITPAN
jgi:hypothetical protein